MSEIATSLFGANPGIVGKNVGSDWCSEDLTPVSCQSRNVISTIILSFRPQGEI